MRNQQYYDEMRADRDAYLKRAEAAETRHLTLFAAIRHGDTAHEAWLQRAIADFFAGRPVERPKGGGNRERAERAEAEVERLRDPESEYPTDSAYKAVCDARTKWQGRAEAAECARDDALAVVEAAQTWRDAVTNRRHRFNAEELALQEALTKFDGGTDG